MNASAERMFAAALIAVIIVATSAPAMAKGPVGMILVETPRRLYDLAEGY